LPQRPDQRIHTAAGLAGAASDPADPRRGPPLRHHRPPRTARQGAHHLDTGGDSGHRTEAPQGTAQPFRWSATAHSCQRRGDCQGAGNQQKAGRVDLCRAAQRVESPACLRLQPSRALMNIPNLITVLRVLLIPIFILLFYLPFHWSYIAASATFALASATDWLDGYLARRLEQSTPFGAFLDPVADKLMVAVALVLLVEHHANIWLTLPAAVIIGREIVISALREWMAELGARARVAVSRLGKWKTAAQMAALVILLANPAEMTAWVMLGYVLLFTAAALTLWSMGQYLLAAWPHLSLTKK